MSDTARDYQTIDPDSTEGLDNLFHESTNHNQLFAIALEMDCEQDAPVSVERAPVSVPLLLRPLFP